MTPAEMEADIAFLLLRAGCAGSCSFTSDRWTGTSSNAIVKFAYGGEQDDMPYDRSDYAACVRTVKRLPKHRRTDAVMGALRRAREAYLERYPTHASSLARKAEHEEWLREKEARAKPRSRRRSPTHTRPHCPTPEK